MANIEIEAKKADDIVKKIQKMVVGIDHSITCNFGSGEFVSANLEFDIDLDTTDILRKFPKLHGRIIKKVKNGKCIKTVYCTTKFLNR